MTPFILVTPTPCQCTNLPYFHHEKSPYCSMYTPLLAHKPMGQLWKYFNLQDKSMIFWFMSIVRLNVEFKEDFHSWKGVRLFWVSFFGLCLTSIWLPFCSIARLQLPYLHRCISSPYSTLSYTNPIGYVLNWSWTQRGYFRHEFRDITGYESVKRRCFGTRSNSLLWRVGPLRDFLHVFSTSKMQSLRWGDKHILHVAGPLLDHTCLLYGYYCRMLVQSQYKFTIDIEGLFYKCI